MSTTITHVETFDQPERWKGYKITISDETKNIVAKIENASICCEVWGS